MRAWLLVAALVAVPARADDLHRDPHAEAHRPDDGDALGFAAALGLADSLPELGAERAAAAATAASARALPLRWAPLTLRATPELGVSAPRGGGLRLALEQLVPLGDRGPATRATVQATAARRAAQARAVALGAQLEIGRAWIDAWTAAALLLRADEELALARAIATTTERAAAAGAATAPEVADAAGLVAEASARRLDAEGRVADTGFALGAAVGAGAARHATGDLPAAPLPDHARWDALLDLAGRLPAARARALEAAAQRARAAEERALRRPELVLGLELTADPGGDRRVAATAGVTLPVHDRGEREAAEARAEALRLDGEAAGLGRRARFGLAQALHDVEHSGEYLEQVERSLVPAVVQAAALRRRAYERGESTVLEVLAAERAAVAGQRTLVEARAAHAWARVQAWLLITALEAP